jgi:ATP-dependent Clp protease ATP-binding subunit ClpX
MVKLIGCLLVIFFIFRTADFFMNFGKFLFLFVLDIIRSIKAGKVFSEYGLTMFCGKQRGGKTVSMVEYLEQMRQKYPKCQIYCNFEYEHMTGQLTGWEQLIDLRSDDGVIFAIDEIHSEFASNGWKDFPMDLLREISQQRKQFVKIVATAQVYKDVVVQLRRQCFEIIECRTIGDRWTFQRCFDAEDYNAFIERNATAERKGKIHRKWRKSFVQTDDLRGLYDTYAKVLAMRKIGFQARQAVPTL